MELQRREQDKEEGVKGEDDEGLKDDLDALSLMLSGLDNPSRAGKTSKKLASGIKPSASPPSSQQSAPPESSAQPSTLTSLATLSDRLTTLETSLGLSTITPTSSTPILPTLASLTAQITTLSITLAPPSTKSPTTSKPLNLDALTARVQDLTSQSDKLTLSRKAATQSAHDLRQARLKAATSPTPPTPHPTYPSDSVPQHLHPHHRPSSTTPKAYTTTPQETLQDLLFHSEQSAQISALYALLPRIQQLSPLLPLVLERLRSLQVIHAGAAAVKADVDALEHGQAELQREIAEWRLGLERVEQAVRDGEAVMGRNREVLVGLVEGVEVRLERLGRLGG